MLSLLIPAVIAAAALAIGFVVGSRRGQSIGFASGHERGRADGRDEGRSTAQLEAEASRQRIERECELLRSDLVAARAARDEAESLRREAESASAAAAATAAAQRERIDAMSALVAETEQRMSGAIKAITLEAIAEGNRQLSETSQRERQTATEQVAAMVTPMAETLAQLRNQVDTAESTRLRDAATLHEKLRAVTERSSELAAQTSALTSALTKPQVRGAWGETTLRTLLTKSGLSSVCDFNDQVNFHDEEGDFRPDSIVNLPTGRIIPIDAKTPLDAFVAAANAANAEAREAELARFDRNVKSHVDTLAQRKYGTRLGATSTDFVVLFMPNEGMFLTAVDRNPDLLEYARAKNVVLACPSSLVAVLATVHQAWGEHRMNENAQSIIELAHKLVASVVTLIEHAHKIGYHLGNSVKSYNAMIGSAESRLLPTARKLPELGVTVPGAKTLTPITTLVREPKATEFLSALDSVDTDRADADNAGDVIVDLPSEHTTKRRSG